MSIDTQNLFAEKTIGPIGSEPSAEVTVKGLAKEVKRQSRVAKDIEKMEPKPKKKFGGVKRVVAGVALTGATLLAAHSVVSTDTEKPNQPPAAESESPDQQLQTPTTLVTVKPGDTMWDIETRVNPGQDPREEVDKMVVRNGGSTELEVGQQIPVDVKDNN